MAAWEAIEAQERWLAEQADWLRIETATRQADDSAAERRVKQLEAAASAARNAIHAKLVRREQEEAAEVAFQKNLAEALERSKLDAAPTMAPKSTGKGRAKSSKTCWMGANCHFQPNCVFVHDDAVHQSRAATRGKSSQTCRNGANCTFGTKCLFTHPPPPPPPAAAVPLQEDPDVNRASECVVCMACPADHLALTCFHLVLCSVCAGTQSMCVVCKAATQFRKVFL